MGVKAPTFLKKQALIDEIVLIQSGKKAQKFAKQKGRSVKSNPQTDLVNNEKTIIDAISLKKSIKKQFIQSILQELEKKLNELL